MGETTNPTPDAEGSERPVHAVELVRRIRDSFAERTAALPPDDLVAYVGREAAAARAELSRARRHVPAA